MSKRLDIAPHASEVPVVPLKRAILITITSILVGISVLAPVGAAEVSPPTTEFTDEFDAGTDLGNYIFDRYDPGFVGPYEPTLTKSTVDGRSVGVLTVDGNGPIGSDPERFYRWEGFKRTTDGTNTGVYANGQGTCLETTFRLDADFAVNDRIVSFWATTNNSDASHNNWPIAAVKGFADVATPDVLSFWASEVTASGPSGWYDLPLPAGWDYDAWHTFTYVLTPTSNVWFLDGVLVWSDAAAYIGGQSTIEYQIFNNVNYGVDYPTYIDSFRAGSCTTLRSDTVTPDTLGSFSAAASNTASGGVTEDHGGSAGPSAWRMDTGAGDGSALGGKSWLYTSALDGRRLAELTEFTYATFVDATSEAAGNLAPAINAQVDWDGDGVRDTTLVWEPVYAAAEQGAVATDTWQTWDALGGKWWYTTNFDPGGGAPALTNRLNEFQPLGWYLERYPRAQILETWGAPGTAFVSGQSSGGIWKNFVGAVDDVVIALANGEKVTTDIEMTEVTANDVAVDQSGVGSDVDVVVPISLAGRNGSLWLNDLTSWVGTDVDVVWEANDTEGVFTSGVTTISGGDLDAQIAFTVPGDRITVTPYTVDVTITDAYNATTTADSNATVTVTADLVVETVGLVEPATGIWHLYDAMGVETTSFYYGDPGDYPFVGDWNCDGVETPGLYRQSDGFVYLRNENTQGNADVSYFFGNPGDVPIAGDFNNDGCDTVSIYRPSEQRIYIINTLGKDGTGLGKAEVDYIYGNPGDKPFIGDWTGDGTDTAGLHRESTGFMYMRNSHTQGIADFDFFYGNPGDRLVAGDWTGNGVSTPAVFRPGDTTMYFRYTNSEGNADFQFFAGQSDWLPVAGRLGQ